MQLGSFMVILEVLPHEFGVIDMKCYASKATGNILIRQEGCFFWKGRYFSGLVDEGCTPPALYDNPTDSFCHEVGMLGAVEEGLIYPIDGEITADMKSLNEVWNEGFKEAKKMLGDLIPLRVSNNVGNPVNGYATA